MAMYYQSSSEIQSDTLQTLYLMNPNYVGYSGSTQPQSNMLFFSSAPAAAAAAVPGINAPPHFVGLPQSHDLGHQENIPAPRLQYNIWSLIDQSADVNQGNTNQALSLSLSAVADQTGGGGGSLKPLPASDFQDFPAWRKNSSALSQATTDSNGGPTAMQSVIVGSKYLKAAQELLDEVANVGNENKNDRNKAKLAKEPNCADTTAATSCGGGEIGEKSGGSAEITTAQRQEIQMKKAKLSTMLDEVEQRYREYQQQMQIVVASFEQAAGSGAAKSYTQLALKTILRQFRCLKCTISAQIRALSRSLGEEDQTIRFVDNQLRQQRALQQLGMMHSNNAWRPQRGLPERAVSVLRAWLFEHFLHPYPKDSDKHMLAKQTGLTRSQVSNWFINARVRLWKPMVEEMYLEEMKNQEQPTKPEPDHDSESPNSKFNPDPEIDNHLNAALQSHQRKLVLNLTENISANSPTGSSLQPRPGISRLFTSLNTKTLPEKNPKKPRNETQDNSPSSILSGADKDMKAVGDQTSKGFMINNNVKFGDARESYVSMAANIGDQQMASMGFNFQGNNSNSSNNFSLSLAPPPSETSSQGARAQNFLLHRKFHEFGTRIAQGGVESSGINSQATAGYEILDFQNRKPFPQIII